MFFRAHSAPELGHHGPVFRHSKPSTIETSMEPLADANDKMEDCTISHSPLNTNVDHTSHPTHDHITPNAKPIISTDGEVEVNTRVDRCENCRLHCEPSSIEVALQTPTLQNQPLVMRDSPLSLQQADDRGAIVVEKAVAGAESSTAHDETLASVEEGRGDDRESMSAASTSECGVEEEDFFETLRPKILALCESVWPGCEVVLEDLDGGGYNRIFGMTISVKEPAMADARPNGFTPKSFNQLLERPKRWLKNLKRMICPTLSRSIPATKTTLRYILRVPRWPDLVDLQYQAAVFDFANGLSKSWTVPTAVHMDSTSDNALGLPFVIQDWIPGTNLDEIWCDLNHQQKLSLSRQIGKIFCDISEHSFPVPGTIDPTSISNESGDNIRIFEHGYPKIVEVESGFQTMMLKTQVPATQRSSALDVLRSRFQTWKERKVHPLYPDLEVTPYTKLTRVAAELEPTAWESEHCFYLSHNDLYPRNIMAAVINDRQVKVTGILDWDLVDIAPAVVAFQPPWWLWKYEKYWEDVQDPAGVIQASEDYAAITTEEKQLRAAFEAKAGSKVVKYANDPNSDLARHLWQWSLDGVGTSWDFELAQEVVAHSKESWSDSDSDSDSSDFEVESG